MNSPFTWLLRPAVFTAAGLLFAVSGCSFLYDLNTNQCNSDADCSQFGDTVCSLEEHVCVANPVSSGGSGNSGGTNPGGGGSKPNGGSGPNGGGHSDGGDAGSSTACTTNADCIADKVDQPSICRKKDSGNECVVLTNEQCQVLLPTSVMGSSTLDLLKTSNPVILGGFANAMNASDPHETLATVNWDMAFKEFNESAAKNSNKSQFQPVLGVICNGTFPNDGDFDASMHHLTEEIGTPAILSTLSSVNLLAAWNYTQSEDYVAQNPDGEVMFLSTGSATLQLANLDDDGYVWHLLGDPRLLAATVASLVREIEPYVKSQQTDSSAPLKLALVSNDNQTLNDIATVLTDAPPANQAVDDPHRFDYLSINGDLAIHQNTLFYQEQTKANDAASAQSAGDDILANPPQIIIGLANNEFADLIKTVEAGWGKPGTPSESVPRPYYVLSHYLATANVVLTGPGGPLPLYGTSATVPALDKRLVGVNYALAQDDHSKTLYDSWLSRVKKFYGSGQLVFDGTENYYDGAYSLLYASSLTGKASPLGHDVRDALQNRVLNPDGTSVDIGPSKVETQLPILLSSKTSKMALWGTDGPPNFDRVSGTRLSATSAWCMNDKGNYVYDYSPDGLLYEASTGTFSAPSSGAPACLSKYEQ